MKEVVCEMDLDFDPLNLRTGEHMGNTYQEVLCVNYKE